jgi:hypothetical protein
MKNGTNDERPQRTYNFNASIGQFIDHVDTINFRMDGNGEFHFGKVDNVNNGGDADGECPRSTEQRMKHCIDTLWEEKVLKHLYDYTWVMETMNQTEGMPHFNTLASFITYLKNIGIESLPSEDSINKKQNVFSGTFPNWVFTDCDHTEATRRINVGKRFMSLYRKK